MTAETWAIIATWVGTFASIVGAVIAIVQANRAKAEADRVESLRVTITGRAVHVDVTEVDLLVSTARDAMSKYGPRGSFTTLQGYEPEKDAETVQQVTQALLRHNVALIEEIGPNCEEIRARLDAALVEFSAKANPADHLECGRKIYTELSAFSGNLQAALRKRLLAPQ